MNTFFSKIIISVWLLFTWSTTQAQCSVNSTNGYTVNIEIQLDSIVRGNDQCPGPGYNYDVALTYDVSFTGSNIPANLNTLQGNVKCGSQSLFFNMNNSGGTASTTTGGNQWNNDCSKLTLADLECSVTSISISGPSISYQTFDCVATILPVDLVSFLAKTFADRVDLEWETVSEINNDYFIIERMQNSDWEAIGQITGNGTTNEVHFYSYTDKQVDVREIAYYRLRQIDFNGSEDVSHIVQSELIELQGHDYRFNQNGSIVSVAFQDKYKERTMVKVLRADGTLVHEKQFEQILGGEVFQIDLSNYSAGWYAIGIIGEDNAHFERMVLID